MTRIDRMRELLQQLYEQAPATDEIADAVGECDEALQHLAEVLESPAETE